MGEVVRVSGVGEEIPMSADHKVFSFERES